MLCRLCLNALKFKDGVSLFDANGCETKTNEFITKYLNLKLVPDNDISTEICSKCNKKLEEFHKFRLMVNEKQLKLHQIENINEHFTNNSPELDIKDLTLDGMRRRTTMLNEVKQELEDTEDEDCNDIKDEDFKIESESESTDTLEMQTAARKVRMKKLIGVREKNDEIINNFMKLSCDLCQCKANNFSQLRTHFEMIHKMGAYVKCCSRTFKQPCQLAEHIKWHRDPEAFKCEICAKVLQSKPSLKNHKKEMHKTERQHECNFCHKDFESNRKLNEHRFNVHKIEHEKQAKHTCEFCNNSFATLSTLKRHIKSIHENVYPHVCDICGKKFKFKPSFERHILEHQGIIDPPMQCKICGEWLKNKHTLRLHAPKHDNVNVNCDICGYVAPSNKALQGHVRYMHQKERKFECSYCDKKFKEKTSLKEHLAVHSGVNLYNCPHCPKEFRCKANMYAHVKKKHKEQWLESKIARSYDPNLKVSKESS